MTSKFKLRFRESRIQHYAERNTNDLSELIAIGRKAGPRGYLTRDEFLTICVKKSPRPRIHYESNGAGLIEEVTAISFAEKTSEQVRIQILQILSGVSWPVASYILHFCTEDQYPILDFRALESLSIEKLPLYTFEFWNEYTAFCRDLAHRNRISMRTLDAALWGYSKSQD